MTMNQPVRASNHAAAPKAKPDARPMRMALGAGGIAAFSALAAAIVLPPQPPQVEVITQPQPQAQATDPGPNPTAIQVVRPIQYIQLLPGQTPPPGATVIGASAPTPLAVVVTVPAPKAAPPKAAPPKAAPPKAAPPKPAPTPIIIKTTQSGKVVP